ncbi:MAG: cysteine sulfinate desulfinase [Ignavibacteria bacterium RIFCSPLOWO2_02_FULL_55_14]|nr:MAG: cysteine sulfinate desulfinase [Ignavibacteria bacterium RIFCSPLOWO2_02_FULL_55_14]OGU72263.1 MAG: cysteine sulfinate desulfinase [Ignavibacteria bacterium RIFCSPLOWO2_12_FULL_56_21]
MITPPTTSVPMSPQTFDVESLRGEFPILNVLVHGHRLVYLDNAATSQKPRAVIRSEEEYYRTMNANVHRGVHTLSEKATARYEESRESIRKYIGAGSAKEIVFVRGTTEAINLVAATYGKMHVGKGDHVVISGMEHHSNIVPWQMLCGETGALLRVIPLNDRGEVILSEYEKILDGPVKLVAISHISNALGTVNPIREMIASAHRRGIPVLVDGAQAMQHGPVDVRELECDFYAFSGHKMFGPTGIGILFGREALLETMPPYQGGGDMIKSVTFEKTIYNDLPHKFEAGTPNIAGAVALGTATEWLSGLDWTAIGLYEQNLLQYATDALSDMPGVRIIGTAERKAGIVSFVMNDIHPHDIGTILDRDGVAIRTGHHCAQPVMMRYGVPATARASFALYNTASEVDALIAALGRVREVMGI